MKIIYIWSSSERSARERKKLDPLWPQNPAVQLGVTQAGGAQLRETALWHAQGLEGSVSVLALKLH